MNIGILIAVVWIIIGPLLVYYYVKYFFSTIQLMSKKQMFYENYSCIKRLYKHIYRRSWPLSIIWPVLVLIILDFVKKSLNRYYIVDEHYYIFLVAIAYISFMTSLGFRLLWSTFLFIIRILNSHYLTIGPYDSFFLEKTKILKRIASKTALFFSSGFAFMPALTELIFSEEKNKFVLILILCYTMTIFIYYFVLYIMLNSYFKTIIEKHTYFLVRTYHSLSNSNRLSPIGLTLSIKEQNFYNQSKIFYARLFYNHLSVSSTFRDIAKNFIPTAFVSFVAWLISEGYIARFISSLFQ
jgi:hypothetical protein